MRSIATAMRARSLLVRVSSTVFWLICLIQACLCLSFGTNRLVTSSSPTATPIPCDFDSYEGTGCEDEEGSFCESETQRCSCKDGFPVRLLAYCLEKKTIGEDCYTTAQCNQVTNAACFIFGKEYDNERVSGGHNVGRQLSNWPTGTCRCNIGYFHDNATDSCVKKATGGWCNEDWDCIKQTFNSQCARPTFTCECTWGYMYDPKTDSCVVPKLFGSKCSSDLECSPERLVCSSPGRCVCPTGFHYDVLHPGCKPNDDSSCQYGYKWDEEWGRCIPARSSSAAAAHFNLNTRTNKHVEPTTTVLEDDDSSPVQTLLILVLPNLVGLALILRYCFRKRDDGTEDLEEMERGMIRPTLSAFDKHRQHQLLMRSYQGASQDASTTVPPSTTTTTTTAAINSGSTADESVPLNPSGECSAGDTTESVPSTTALTSEEEQKKVSFSSLPPTDLKQITVSNVSASSDAADDDASTKEKEIVNTKSGGDDIKSDIVDLSSKQCISVDFAGTDKSNNQQSSSIEAQRGN